MSSKLINDELFYNGAERYQNMAWELFTNISRTYVRHSDICIEHSNLLCKISTKAYDRFGNLLPDSLAFLVPVGIDQTEAFRRYEELSINLGRTYGEKLIKAGLVADDFFGWEHLPYIGCEEEYGLPKLHN